MNIGLEEIRFNDDRMVWEVTIGFSRPWDQVSEKNWILPGERVRYDRTYKVVEIADTDGRVLGISNRALSEAA